MDYLAHMPAKTDLNQSHKNVKLNSKSFHMFLVQDLIQLKYEGMPAIMCLSL